MKNLENFGVFELKTQEMIFIEGGGKIGGLKKLWQGVKKYGGAILEAAGVYDAISEFKEGYNEESC